MPIPDFRDDGYLPMGIYLATEAEVAERFGRGSFQRAKLMDRLSVWLGQARAVKAVRFLVDGSFVASKPDPNDVDCAVWVPKDFDLQYQWGKIEAVRLYQADAFGQPEEIYLLSTADEWSNWTWYFGQIRDDPVRRKGIIEVTL